MTRLGGSGQPRASRLATGVLALLVALLAGLAVRVATQPRALPVGIETATRIEPPRPLSPDETYVRSEVLATGDVEVTQWIESRVLLFSVDLSVPPVTGSAEVVAEDVQVVGDGRPAPGPDSITSGSGSYALLAARSVQITYRLTGAVQRSGSAPGRALVRLTSLDVTADQSSTTVTRTVIADEVLSLSCSPATGDPAPGPCGRAHGVGTWSVDLTGPRSLDRVMASVTLG